MNHGVQEAAGSNPVTRTNIRVFPFGKALILLVCTEPAASCILIRRLAVEPMSASLRPLVQIQSLEPRESLKT